MTILEIVINAAKILEANTLWECPKEGKFICYKAGLAGENNDIPVVITLEVPADAKRISPMVCSDDVIYEFYVASQEIKRSKKCRCDKAKVIEITAVDDVERKFTIAKSFFANISYMYNIKKIIYKVGEYVYADSFDDDPLIECTHGIHFFMNRQDAIDFAEENERIKQYCLHQEQTND